MIFSYFLSVSSFVVSNCEQWVFFPSIFLRLVFSILSFRVSLGLWLLVVAYVFWFKILYFNHLFLALALRCSHTTLNVSLFPIWGDGYYCMWHALFCVIHWFFNMFSNSYVLLSLHVFWGRIPWFHCFLMFSLSLVGPFVTWLMFLENITQVYMQP